MGVATRPAERDQGSFHTRGTLQGSPWAIVLSSPLSRIVQIGPTLMATNLLGMLQVIGIFVIFWQIINTKEPLKWARLTF